MKEGEQQKTLPNACMGPGPKSSLVSTMVVSSTDSSGSLGSSTVTHRRAPSLGPAVVALFILFFTEAAQAIVYPQTQLHHAIYILCNADTGFQHGLWDKTATDVETGKQPGRGGVVRRLNGDIACVKVVHGVGSVTLWACGLCSVVCIGG